MKTWIALLRGINMVGRHRLPMKELVALLEGLGARCEGARNGGQKRGHSTSWSPAAER